MVGLTVIFLRLIIGVIINNGLLNEDRKVEICLFSSILHLALAGNTKKILQRRQQSLISSFHVCFENIQVGRLVKSFVGKFRNDQHWVRQDAYKIFPCGKYL